MRAKSVEKMTRRRRAHQIRKGQAVSPVVATLILILVAVAAAAALYLWLVAWQGGVTKNIGSTGAQYTLTIGGSTTVFPLDQQAIKYFQENNSNVVVNNNPGGSGAGLLAVCSGAIDIAAMSRPMKATELTTCPTAIQKVLGYDAVVVTTAVSAPGATTNTAGIASFGEGELLAIYWQNGGQPSAASGFPAVLGPAAGGANDLVGSPGVPAASGVPGFWGLQAPTGTAGAQSVFQWTNVPKVACFDSALVAHGGTLTASGYAATPPTSGPCTAWNNAGAFQPTAYGTGALNINVYGRADNGGTSEAFNNNLLGISCGTDNQLASCGFQYTVGGTTSGTIDAYTGNGALLAAEVKDANSLGYNSWGFTTDAIANGGAAQGTSAATIADAPVMGNSQTAPVVVSLGTIKTGIAAGYGVQVNGGYIGWRPLQYVTLGNPTGESERFIQFVLQPGTDQTLCLQNHYISVYS